MAMNVVFPIPPTPPSSTDKINFRARYDAFFAYIQNIGTLLISFITQLNSTETNINAKEASATSSALACTSSANFQGTWVNKTTSVGESWAFNGIIYRVVIAGTTSPITTPANWLPITYKECVLATPVASATTTTIGTAASGDTVHITGTTTITSFGVSTTGTLRIVVFDGALALSHNAVSLILPTGANIVTAAGDTAEFICEHGANQYWRCTGYQRKDGTALYTGYANISTVGSLGQQSGILSASFTLAQSHAGKMQVCTPGITVTLPPINTIASGSCFILKNVGGSPYTPVTIAVNGNGLESVSLKIVPNEILILQSDGGSTYRLVSRTGRTPMYDDSNIAITYNTVYQAATDLTLIAVLAGSYINGAQLVVGNTSSPTRVLSQFGDDINSNTKEATMTAVIPAGMYYAVQPQGASAWEITVSITAYPHK